MEKIKEQLKLVFEHLKVPADDKVLSSIVDKWFAAKRPIIDKYLDGKYIKDCGPVSITMDKEVKTSYMDHYICMLQDAGHYMAADFVASNDYEGFFSNRITIDNEKLALFYPAKKELRQGMRLFKALKYFIADKDELEFFQNKASEYIQKDKICGNLYISVHPLDFLTSSENNNNWRSCHALSGAYCAGNLSYILDSCTAICYIASPEEEQLVNLPQGLLWNSKRWRTLAYFNQQDYTSVMLNIHYPFDLPPANKLIFDALGLKNISSTRYLERKEKNVATDIVFDDVEHSKIKVENGENAINFNDITMTYRKIAPVIATNKINTVHDLFTIGHKTPCIRCGHTNKHSESFYCYPCRERLGMLNPDKMFEDCYCAICGIPVDYYLGYRIDDSYYCRDCFDKAKYGDIVSTLEESFSNRSIYREGKNLVWR